LYDNDGKRYIDCIASNLCYSIGINHPYTTKLVKDQLEFMPHLSSMYFNDKVSEFTEKLMKHAPKRKDGKK